MTATVRVTTQSDWSGPTQWGRPCPIIVSDGPGGTCSVNSRIPEIEEQKKKKKKRKRRDLKQGWLLSKTSFTAMAALPVLLKFISPAVSVPASALPGTRLIKLGTGEAGGGIIIGYLLLLCHQQNGSCIKMGSDESHFNVSLIVRDKVSRSCGRRRQSQFTTFLKRTESRSGGIEPRPPSSYQANALPLGQTSSHILI